MLSAQHARGCLKHVRYLTPSCMRFNQAAHRAGKTTQLPSLALAAVFARDPFPVQAELLAFTSDKERERGRKRGKKMFDLYRCAVWKVKCDSNVRRLQKKGTNYSRIETDKAFLVKNCCTFLASWSSNSARISSLIKQHVSQCSKDYYEWHFTSKRPNDRL